MYYHIEAEIFSEKGTFAGGGLYFSMSISEISIKQLFELIEKEARAICKEKERKFTEVSINKIRKKETENKEV